MKIRFATLVFAGAVAATAGACSNSQEMLGLGKRSPDEFAVYSRAPLSMPPGYGLRPPEPGSDRPSPGSPGDQARQAMLSGRSASSGYGGAYAGGSAPTPLPGASTGTETMLARTGALDADPGIRAVVNAETSILAEEDQSFTERLMFWSKPTAYGSVVDPLEEKQRISENQALGKSVTAGTTPVIERKRRALLEGIFD
ncbi:MAG: DUF3035 domain-containing protein [Rhodospirillales bacterium]|nr:DUF3035 domain-containing protein [Rhodospirillales bacterium]